MQPLPIAANRVHWATGPKHSPNGRHPAWRRQRGEVEGWSWGEHLPQTRRVVGHVQGCPRACQGSRDLGQGPVPVTNRWRPDRRVTRDRRVCVAPCQGPVTRVGRARLPQQRGSTARAAHLPSTSLQDADELFHWTRPGSSPRDDDQGLGRGVGRSYWAGALCARRGGSWLCSSKAYCWQS